MLIAANEAGYGNLVRLVSRAYLETARRAAVHVPLEWLDGLAEGMICLTGGPRGPIGTRAEERPSATRRRAACWR